MLRRYQLSRIGTLGLFLHCLGPLQITNIQANNYSDNIFVNADVYFLQKQLGLFRPCLALQSLADTLLVTPALACGDDSY